METGRKEYIDRYLLRCKTPVLLITAAISPQEVKYLKLRNPNIRLEQYIDSLKFYITSTEVKKIVFCDNSNYNFDKRELLLLAKKHGKKVEIIQFEGNQKSIRFYGKGFGEGEIIKFALGNSRLLKSADYFIKVTGRLKITNINNILKGLNANRVYFNKSIIEYKCIDTVLYCIPKKIYVKYFLNAYQKVYDRKGIYIEHVFRDIITDNNIFIYNIPYYPNIKGDRGTVARPYQENMFIEKHFYNLLSKLNLFNCSWVYHMIFKLHKMRKTV